MERIDGRKFNQLRPIKITPDFVDFAEGSVLIECGATKVLCCASVEEGAPDGSRRSTPCSPGPTGTERPGTSAA